MSPRRPCQTSAATDDSVPFSLGFHGVWASVGVDADVTGAAEGLFDNLATLSTPLSAGACDGAGSMPLVGRVQSYREDEVLRHVSAGAVRVECVDPALELYRDGCGERYWRVDETWGLCEVDLLRRSWRSWVLERPGCDGGRLLGATVLWPLAQLARANGIHLIPATALGRDGRGVLILSPYDVSPEIEALAGRGVGVVGRDWVALREEADGRVSLLPLGTGGEAAECELVLLVEPMRRAAASARPLTVARARDELRRLWPIPLLAAGRSATAPNGLAARMARSSRVHRVRLGPDGDDLARMLAGEAARPMSVAA